MKIKQTDTDMGLIKKQLEKKKEELIKESQRLEYNKALIEKQNFLREHDDKYRPFLRNQKDEDDKRVIKQFESDLENIKRHIKELKDSLEGKKVPIGIS